MNDGVVTIHGQVKPFEEGGSLDTIYKQEWWLGSPCCESGRVVRDVLYEQ